MNGKCFFRGHTGNRENFPLPDVTAEEHLDRGGQRDGDNGSQKTPNKQSPNEDRSHHGHRVQPDGFADDFWRNEETIDLNNHDENGRDDQGEKPPRISRNPGAVATLDDGDDHRRNPTNDGSHIRDKAEETEHQPNEQPEI